MYFDLWNIPKGNHAQFEFQTKICGKLYTMPQALGKKGRSREEISADKNFLSANKHKHFIMDIFPHTRTLKTHLNNSLRMRNTFDTVTHIYPRHRATCRARVIYWVFVGLMGVGAARSVHDMASFIALPNCARPRFLIKFAARNWSRVKRTMIYFLAHTHTSYTGEI